jgi:hypothetical protein
MALTQEQVSAWFDANPNATADDVAAAVRSVGGLDANEGLAGMIASRYAIAEPEVTNYYNAYLAPEQNNLTAVTTSNNAVLDDTADTYIPPTGIATLINDTQVEDTSTGLASLPTGGNTVAQVADTPTGLASLPTGGNATTNNQLSGVI